MVDPSESTPPAPDAASIINGAQAETHDIAEQLRDLWVSVQSDSVLVKHRDMLYEVACIVHQACGMLDALGTVFAASKRYHDLKTTTPVAVDWHEVPIAPAPALPEGGAAL